MKKKELSQLFYLNKEIAQLEQHKQELQHQIRNLGKTSDTVKGSSTSYPFVLHSILVTGIRSKDKERVLRLKADLADIEKLIDLRSQQCVVEYNRLMRYINTIDDSLIRQILTLRFVNNLPWNRVASNIGGSNTEDSVRKACVRFLQKN
ncbi:hypothetical protein EDD70_1051 [Hydrogenoanaerobacterium saccharovorans]|uniref:DUF1492 domain-containing protein n=1 Tax=Hydrogenoanaerobacterium saccharovorans TaxID=474960 RepID=A0A1H8A0Q8_9FIRM|nr:hypothetical protein [Hydrogenoanaerobacterium saccharovorans]RPF48236.1 hypothetical protein EDD70_1051 [Hydrogenoanaerobacterium saccharovorans]SEM64325.1 hypothetical protein SAMN05216180_1040 [Hydrogenoanaerobacterium saccharovorans]